MTVYCTGSFIHNLHNSARSHRSENTARVSKSDLIPVIKREFPFDFFLIYKGTVKTSQVSDYETLFEFEGNKTVNRGNTGIEYSDMIISLAADNALFVNFSLISAAPGVNNKFWHYLIFRDP